LKPTPMLLLLLLFFISSTRADFASVHVRSFLNNSVAPCANFYRHVCSASMALNDTVYRKSEIFYEELANNLQSRTRNNPVMNDIAEARAGLNCTFDGDVYSTLLDERCKTNFDCFFDEYLYFFTLYNKTNENVDDSLKFYSTHGNKTNNRSIAQSKKATSRMVERLFKNSDHNITKAFNRTASTYQLMNDRLFVMEFLNKNDTAEHVGLEKIHNLTKEMKAIVMRKFQETSWMKPVNEFGFTILSQYLVILDELIILTDFDSFDRNLTTLRRINHEYTTRYLENNQRTTGCTWFDVTHSFNTTGIQMEKKYSSSYEEEIEYFRMVYSLIYNAFNYVEASIIVVLGPAFYPLNDNSSDTTMVCTGDILGHEIYHSFITEALLNRSEEYKSEAECMHQHYNQSCQLFAEGECNSGSKTFSEDGADVEGTRAAYDLLLKKLSNDQLQEFEYPDLRITREQSFFYSVAMRSCRDVANSEYREHSPDNIRVNAMFSQMPEFSRAFSCQTDDVLYSEPDRVCYLFGAKSTGKQSNVTIEKEEKGTAKRIERYDEGA
ncbi:hypothetical protein PENTCL1PPCAC_29665, partial [Pristionchus entomophagus]